MQYIPLQKCNDYIEKYHDKSRIVKIWGAVVAERLALRTSIPEVPRFEPRPGSSALGQGALSSLPSLSEETLSRRSRV